MLRIFLIFGVLVNSISFRMIPKEIIKENIEYVKKGTSCISNYMRDLYDN